MDFDFDLQYCSRGLPQQPDDTLVVDNGTFFNNRVLPQFGYQTEAQTHRPQRAPQVRPRSRCRGCRRSATQAARQFNLHQQRCRLGDLRHHRSTAADQIAMAPGYLQKEWTANGRRYFHYRMDKPMLKFFSFQSARYAVKHETWKGVEHRGLLRPAARLERGPHDQAMKKALDYYARPTTAVPVPPVAHPGVPGLRAASPSRSPTPCRCPSGSASSPTCATRIEIDYVNYVDRARSRRTSGGRTR